MTRQMDAAVWVEEHLTSPPPHPLHAIFVMLKLSEGFVHAVSVSVCVLRVVCFVCFVYLI